MMWIVAPPKIKQTNKAQKGKHIKSLQLEKFNAYGTAHTNILQTYEKQRI